jgi:hypothetical protein
MISDHSIGKYFEALRTAQLTNHYIDSNILENLESLNDDEKYEKFIKFRYGKIH